MYGRTGTDEQKATALKTLSALGWAPFRMSSNDQLLPIRQLDVARKQLKIEGDDKLSADEKKKALADVAAETTKLSETVKAAETSERTKRLAAFLEADKAGKVDDVKKVVAEVVAGFAKK